MNRYYIGILDGGTWTYRVNYITRNLGKLTLNHLGDNSKSGFSKYGKFDFVQVMNRGIGIKMLETMDKVIQVCLGTC